MESIASLGWGSDFSRRFEYTPCIPESDLCKDHDTCSRLGCKRPILSDLITNINNFLELLTDDHDMTTYNPSHATVRSQLINAVTHNVNLGKIKSITENMIILPFSTSIADLPEMFKMIISNILIRELPISHPLFNMLHFSVTSDELINDKLNPKTTPANQTTICLKKTLGECNFRNHMEYIMKTIQPGTIKYVLLGNTEKLSCVQAVTLQKYMVHVSESIEQHVETYILSDDIRTWINTVISIRKQKTEHLQIFVKNARAENLFLLKNLNHWITGKRVVVYIYENPETLNFPETCQIEVVNPNDWKTNHYVCTRKTSQEETYDIKRSLMKFLDIMTTVKKNCPILIITGDPVLSNFLIQTLVKTLTVYDVSSNGKKSVYYRGERPSAPHVIISTYYPVKMTHTIEMVILCAQTRDLNNELVYISGSQAYSIIQKVQFSKTIQDNYIILHSLRPAVYIRDQETVFGIRTPDHMTMGQSLENSILNKKPIRRLFLPNDLSSFVYDFTKDKEVNKLINILMTLVKDKSLTTDIDVFEMYDLKYRQPITDEMKWKIKQTLADMSVKYPEIKTSDIQREWFLDDDCPDMNLVHGVLLKSVKYHPDSNNIMCADVGFWWKA
ncbi:hypothetical protein [Salmon gill poxvirus]|nr:hypothetical protein [Salmon gill poxvirus]